MLSLSPSAMSLRSFMHSQSEDVVAGPRPAVLVAEGEDASRDRVASALSCDGYHVTAVRDGGRLLVRVTDAFVAGLTWDAYELIVAGVHMPVCGGIDVLEALRDVGCRTPAILLASSEHEAIHARAKAVNAVVFVKPFDVDDLRTAAVNMIGRRHSTAQRSVPGLS